MYKKRIPSSDDWRRQGQEEYLANKTLVRMDYKPYRKDWDHDHCEFCGAKFSLVEDDLHCGYSTMDNYWWICDDCFEDFKNEYKWGIKHVNT